MYVDSCLFWEGTVLLSNSLIPQIREILDFMIKSRVSPRVSAKMCFNNNAHRVGETARRVWNYRAGSAGKRRGHLGAGRQDSRRLCSFPLRTPHQNAPSQAAALGINLTLPRNCHFARAQARDPRRVIGAWRNARAACSSGWFLR